MQTFVALVLSQRL